MYICIISSGGLTSDHKIRKSPGNFFIPVFVLPSGFQKIRYYGFLNNRMRSKNLELIFRIQGGQRFRSCYIRMTMAELMKTIWKIDLSICPVCGCHQMRHLGRTFASSG